MTKLLIAEDEAPQRSALQSMLEELWPSARVVAACEDGITALEAFERERPEVAFLDVQLPGQSGIELARAIGDRAQLVFVTAHDSYAVRAFEHGAVDYLLKPVHKRRLTETIARLKSRLTAPIHNDVEQLLTRLSRELAPQRTLLKWISASIGDTIKLYGIDEVLAFHAQDKYTRVVTRSDDAIIRKSLRELLAGLDADVFWQVHRSVVVRTSAIDCVRRDEQGHHVLTLKGRSDVFPVSSAFHGRFRGM
ncbi:MAG TPA: LytTR family DNA-binding domain-containing protein [Polyangiales bacterium]